MTDWMQTYKRIPFQPMEPVIEQIDIEDIAHALSMICRFGGHTREFYSVAEHSVHVSMHCNPEHALAGLLHDAAEAYVGDLIRPIKRQLGMEAYCASEDRILELILKSEGLATNLPVDVHEADNAVLAAERDHDYIVGGAITPWAALPPPAPVAFVIFPPVMAKRMFMARYNELKGRNITE